MAQRVENNAFGEGTAEPANSSMWAHVSFKMHFYGTWASDSGCIMSSWPLGIVSSTIGKLMIPWFWHHRGKEIAPRAVWPHKKAVLNAIWPKYHCPLLFGEHQGGPQMRFWSPKRLRPHKVTSTVPRFCLGKTEVCCVLATDWGAKLG